MDSFISERTTSFSLGFKLGIIGCVIGLVASIAVQLMLFFGFYELITFTNPVVLFASVLFNIGVYFLLRQYESKYATAFLVIVLFESLLYFVNPFVLISDLLLIPLIIIIIPLGIILYVVPLVILLKIIDLTPYHDKMMILILVPIIHTSFPAVLSNMILTLPLPYIWSVLVYMSAYFFFIILWKITALMIFKEELDNPRGVITFAQDI